MMKNHLCSAVLAAALPALCAGCGSGGGRGIASSPAASVPEAGWQAVAAFPDWLGEPDNSLALNSVCSYEGCHGQGELYVDVRPEVASFQMYVNGQRVDTSLMAAGKAYRLDVSAVAADGANTVQVAGIEPPDVPRAVTVYAPYPVVLPGTPQEAGISPKAFALISRLITCDVRNGFPGAQLAVIKDGRLVYEGAWGRTNAYLPDGTPDASSPAVTTDTLFDLASVTKMLAANYALQKLVTDGALSLDAKITEFLGDRFADDTLDLAYAGQDYPGGAVMREWKRSLDVRDLLRHQGGFPSGPQYYNARFDMATQRFGEGRENVLFAGNDGSAETRGATLAAICRTPLLYEPGTRTLYSDVDYMVLGAVAEQVAGMDLDSYLKETFCVPMGLERLTYAPLEHGFAPEDCAATELNGNTRGGFVSYPGVRTETVRGEVHDEKAYYSMGGVSGHAGLFGTARDVAVLASVMLTGGYGMSRFFSRDVIDTFTAPKREDAAGWGLGWWREGGMQRAWYFGAQAPGGAFGHTGWTGTLVAVDPRERMVVAYLTNRVNSPLADGERDLGRFYGNDFTAGTLGFVPQIVYLGLHGDDGLEERLAYLAADMAQDALRLAEAREGLPPGHPLLLNVRSKLELLDGYAAESRSGEFRALARRIAARARRLPGLGE